VNKKQPLKILLVEDEAIIAMTLEIKLKESGYGEVQTVSTGEGAVESLPKTKPDLILMDIRLSGEWDGIETARRIRQISVVPIVFITGCIEQEFVREAKKITLIRYMIKPIKIEELLSIVDSLF
jgi:DNA-binding response OmpR family regulator